MNLAQVFRALRQRKLVQTLMVYAGASWGVLQVVSFFGSTYGWPRAVIDAVLLLLACGLAAALTIAWYHGEKGQQSVGRAEIAILVLLAVVAAGGGWRLARRPDGAATLGNEGALSDGTLAVLPFENRTGDASKAWLEDGLAEMFTTDLAQYPNLRVVTGERVHDLLKQQGVAEAAILPEPAVLKVARSANAGHVLRGTVYAVGGNVRLDVRLVRVRSNTVAAAAHAEGPEILPLVDQVAAELGARLQAGAAPAAKAAPAATLADVATGNIDAYREYQLGLDAERNLRLRDAMPHFRRAVELDSTFAQALTHLAITELNFGDHSQALDHLLAAQRNLAHATQRDSLFVQGIVAFALNDRATAAARLEALTQRYPDEKDAYLILGGLYSEQPARRQAVLRKVLRLDPFYAPAYNQLAYEYVAQKDFPRADSMARAYISMAPKEPNPYDTHGEVLELWGRYAEARTAYLAAIKLRPDFPGVMQHLVRNAERSGRLDEARADIAPLTRSDNPLVRVNALFATGEAYLWRARLDDMLATYQQAYDAAAGGEPQLRMSALAGLASIWALQGDYARAAQALQPMASGASPLKNQYFIMLGELGRFGEMEAGLRELRAIAAQPGRAAFAAGPLHQFQAYIAYARHDWPRAIEEYRAFKQAMRLPPDYYVDSREVMALVNAGRAAEALPLFKEPDPRSLSASAVNSRAYLRGRVYEALGRRAEAAAAYRELVKNWGPMLPRIAKWKDVPQRLARLGG